MMPFLLTGFKQIFSTAKKIFLVVAAIIIVIGLFSYFLNKDKASLQSTQVDPIKKNREVIYKFINDPKLKSTKEGKLTIVVYKKMMCGIIGEACTNNPTDGDKNFGKSAFGFISKLIVFPFVNPPASGVYWVYSGLQSAGFVPKTYAAEGIGFAAIKPLSNLWKIFRDVSYMILVIVLIAIGFMIMFRMKINPQTVISVESALPKIVIALILITFSFAIAGFLIDLMYLVIALSVSVLSRNNTYYDAGKVTNDYIASNMWRLLDVIVNKPDVERIGSSIIALGGVWVNIIIRTLSGIISIWLLPAGAKLLIEGLDKLTGLIPINTGIDLKLFIEAIGTVPVHILLIILSIFAGFFWVPQIIVGFLVLTTLIFLFFRLFFYLFNVYFRLFLYIIFSPIILLFEAIPSGKSVFSWWFKSLLVDILTFPIIIVLLLVGFNIQTQAAAGTTLWAPPFLGGIDANIYSILLGMAIILMIPELMKLVRELFGVKDLPIGFGIGTFFGGAGAAVGGITGTLSQYGSIALALNYIPGASGFMKNFAEKGFGAFKPATPRAHVEPPAAQGASKAGFGGQAI